MSATQERLDVGIGAEHVPGGGDGSITIPPRSVLPISPTRALIAALELGILADYLMRANGLGINITLWCWALLITTVIVTRNSGVVLDRRRIALLAGAAFFAAVPAWRSGESMVFFSGLAVLTLIVLSAWTASPPASTSPRSSAPGASTGSRWCSTAPWFAGRPGLASPIRSNQPSTSARGSCTSPA